MDRVKVFKLSFRRVLSVFSFIVFVEIKCVSPEISMAVMTTDQLVNHWGYDAETHEVMTEDGYILKVHRIPRDGPPVLFQHGILGASDSWVLRGPGKDLAFMLANQGYDVWLNNCRGNTYSRKHATMSPKDAKFWDFSWHEIGYYDLPAVIDYMINTTGYSNVFYIGHSMGTTMFFVLGATRPEYNAKIAIQFSLAPVAFVSHMTLSTATKPLANNARSIVNMFQRQNIFEILPRRSWLSKLLAFLCAEKNYQPFCLWYTFSLSGYDMKQVNPMTVPLFASHFPSGTSAKTLQHFAQGLLSGQFRKFSYGKMKNLEIYGNETAPSYDLSLVTAPVSLHYSVNDFLSNPEDVDTLARKLPNVIGKYVVPFKDFNHIDYLWARDSRTLLYDQVLNIINDHASSANLKSSTLQQKKK